MVYASNDQEWGGEASLRDLTQEEMLALRGGDGAQVGTSTEVDLLSDSIKSDGTAGTNIDPEPYNPDDKITAEVSVKGNANAGIGGF